jgi:hypothetical protein
VREVYVVRRELRTAYRLLIAMHGGKIHFGVARGYIRPISTVATPLKWCASIVRLYFSSSVFVNYASRLYFPCAGIAWLLDGPGIGSRWGRHPHPSRPALGLTQPPIQWVPGFVPGVKRPGRGVNHPPPCSDEVKERIELYLYSRLWGFMACFKVILVLV